MLYVAKNTVKSQKRRNGASIICVWATKKTEPPSNIVEILFNLAKIGEHIELYLSSWIVWGDILVFYSIRKQHCLIFRPLPGNFEKVIKDSGIARDDGIILVSFGSWLQPEYMPPKIIRAITSILDKIPQLIFLKWNSSGMLLSKVFLQLSFAVSQILITNF